MLIVYIIQVQLILLHLKYTFLEEKKYFLVVCIICFFVFTHNLNCGPQTYWGRWGPQGVAPSPALGTQHPREEASWPLGHHCQTSSTCTAHSCLLRAGGTSCAPFGAHCLFSWCWAPQKRACLHPFASFLQVICTHG